MLKYYSSKELYEGFCKMAREVPSCVASRMRSLLLVGDVLSFFEELLHGGITPSEFADAEIHRIIIGKTQLVSRCGKCLFNALYKLYMELECLLIKRFLASKYGRD